MKIKSLIIHFLLGTLAGWGWTVSQLYLSFSGKYSINELLYKSLPLGVAIAIPFWLLVYSFDEYSFERYKRNFLLAILIYFAVLVIGVFTINIVMYVGGAGLLILAMIAPYTHYAPKASV